VNGKPIRLTAQEVEGLEQVVSAGHKWIDGTNPAYPGLILKVGRAFLEALNHGSPQELYLSEAEAWYLREIVPANMRVRGEAVGQGIKKKLYPLILDFDAEKYSQAAAARYGLSAVEEPLTRDDVLKQQSGQQVPGGADALPEAAEQPRDEHREGDEEDEEGHEVPGTASGDARAE
jgi:hypothetical protein